jgi:predicted DNA-binding transcriptional regulator AlpA
MANKPAHPDPTLLTVSDVMARLGVSRSTVLREINHGRLCGQRRSASPKSPFMIEAKSVEEYLWSLGRAAHE